MPKKLSETQKRDMIDCFTNGETINQLSEKYQITNATITRHLKKEIDTKTFKSLVKKNNKIISKTNLDIKKNLKYEFDINQMNFNEKPFEENSFNELEFIEISPLNYEIDNESQKDLTSVSISEIDLPKVVYMIVDNKIELEIKLLKEYPVWQFLSQAELNRKTIEIYFDMKTAKKFCSNDQKVIKVPNTNVFKIVAPFLVSRGVSRIVSEDILIAL